MVHSLSAYLTCSRKVLDVLAEVARKKPQLILDIALPVFLAELPDSETSETRDLVRRRKPYKAVLAALAQISSERVIFEVLLRRLFSKLDIILSSIFRFTSSLIPDSTSSISYPHAILGTIFLILRNKAESEDADLPSYVDTLIPTLLSKVIIPAAIPGPRTRVLCSPEVVHVVSLIINVIVRTADIQIQNSFYQELFNLYVSSEPSSLISSNHEEIAQRFRPFSPDAEDAQAETVEIFVAAVAAARSQAGFPMGDTSQLLLQAVEIVTGSHDDPRRSSLLKMTSCILNKEQSDAQIRKFVDSVVDNLWTSKQDHDRRKESLELISWVYMLRYV